MVAYTKDKSIFERPRLPVLILSILYILGVISLLWQRFNYIFYIPTSYRVIYIPVCFWLFYLTYFSLVYKLFFAKELSFYHYIRKGIFPIFCLHLYILLGNLIIDLFNNQGLLSNIYFMYIKSVFLIFTTVIVTITGRAVLNSSKDMEKMSFYIPLIISLLFFMIFNLCLKHFTFAAFVAASVPVGIAFSLTKSYLLRALSKKVLSKNLYIIIAIFIIAFIMRFSFGITLVNKTTHGTHGYDGYLYASDDGLTYDATALKILKDPSILMKGGVAIWGNWDEFYSIFLAMIYKLFGRNFYILTSIQSFLGSFIPVFVFLIGKMLFSRTVGIIAAISLSFKGGLIMLSAYMGHEAAWLPILYFLMFLMTGYFVRAGAMNVMRDLIMGITAGILCTFRSMYLYFLPFLWMWELLFFRKIKISRTLVHLSVITLLSLAVTLSVFHIFKNDIHLVNKDKAAILWYTSRPVPPFQFLGNERLDPLGINLFRDAKGSLLAIARHPVAFTTIALKIYPLRIVAYFQTYQFGIFDPVYMVNPANLANRFATTLEFYFTLFFIAGIIWCILKKGTMSSPIFILLVFHVLFYAIILFEPSPRVKETSTPFVYLIGSFGAYKIFKFLTQGNNINMLNQGNVDV